MPKPDRPSLRARLDRAIADALQARTLLRVGRRYRYPVASSGLLTSAEVRALLRQDLLAVDRRPDHA